MSTSPLTQPGARRRHRVPPPTSPDGGDDLDQSFAGYTLICRLSCNDWGAVYRARPASARVGEHDVALKVLSADLSAEPTVVEQFRQEAYVMSLLHHPNVVRTFETGIHADRFFIATEFVDGCDLHTFLGRCHELASPIPIPMAVFVVVEILKGLSAAHNLCDADGRALGLIHRDIKPSNVFLSFNGHIKLGDFGVAALQGVPSDFAGTAGYVAPEYFAGAPPDQRGDIFAVGVLLWEMLAGCRLFQGKDGGEIIAANQRGCIADLRSYNPDVPQALQAAVERALSRDRQLRFVSSEDMLDALGGHDAPPPGMLLGAASLIRQAFLSDYKESVLGPSFALGGAGRLVAVCIFDRAICDDVRGALLEHGYWVENFAAISHLGEQLRMVPCPDALVVQVDADGFDAQLLLAQLARAVNVVPVVAVSRHGWHLNTMLEAFSVGAVDLVFAPVRLPRLVTAVEMAARRLGVADRDDVGLSRQSPRPVLLASSDTALVANLTSAMGNRGFRFLCVSGHEQALHKLNESSYRVAIFDARGDLSACNHFVTALRSSPGMGMVSVLALVDRALAGETLGQSRVMLRPRTDSPVVLGAVLQELLAQSGRHRAFTRIRCHIASELLHAGRANRATITDVSRLGVGLSCRVVPPVGAAVRLLMQIPTPEGPIEAAGVVTRVEPPDGDSVDSVLGIELTGFAGGEEARWIAFVTEQLKTNPVFV